VPRVRQQSQAVGDQPAGDLHRHDAGRDRERDGEPAPVAGVVGMAVVWMPVMLMPVIVMRVMMIMAVTAMRMMQPHDQTSIIYE